MWPTRIYRRFISSASRFSAHPPSFLVGFVCVHLTARPGIHIHYPDAYRTGENENARNLMSLKLVRLHMHTLETFGCRWMPFGLLWLPQLVAFGRLWLPFGCL